MKQILILCNGNPPSRPLLERCYAWADYFIAADGGGNIALDMEITPDVVIGDLDSFKKLAVHPFEVICEPDQESNDLEKALALARQKGGEQIKILGATGLRLDQTLKNLSVLKQFNDQFEHICMVDNFGETQLIPRFYQKELSIGTQVSLFPLSGKVTGITTTGLQFLLKNEALENGVRDGSSNKVISNPVEITYEKGDLLLFIADG